MDEGAGEGYDSIFFKMVLELLSEVIWDNGAGCPSAVCYGTSCYIAYQGFRQGISPSDPLFPDEYVRRVDKIVYQFSWQVYRYALDNKPPREKEAFQHLILDTSLIPLPEAVIRGATWFPPEPEIDFFKQVYGHPE